MIPNKVQQNIDSFIHKLETPGYPSSWMTCNIEGGGTKEHLSNICHASVKRDVADMDEFYILTNFIGQNYEKYPAGLLELVFKSTVEVILKPFYQYGIEFIKPVEAFGEQYAFGLFKIKKECPQGFKTFVYQQCRVACEHYQFALAFHHVMTKHKTTVHEAYLIACVTKVNKDHLISSMTYFGNHFSLCGENSIEDFVFGRPVSNRPDWATSVYGNYADGKKPNIRTLYNMPADPGEKGAGIVGRFSRAAGIEGSYGVNRALKHIRDLTDER